MSTRPSLALLLAVMLTCMVRPLPGGAQIEAGARGGGSLATMLGGSSEGRGYKVGAMVGAFADIPLTRIFGVQPTLSFVEKAKGSG